MYIVTNTPIFLIVRLLLLRYSYMFRPSMLAIFRLYMKHFSFCVCRRGMDRVCLGGFLRRSALRLFTVPIRLLIFGLFQNIVFWVGGWWAISAVRLPRAPCMLLQWTRFPDRSSFEQLSEMSRRRLQSCTKPRFVAGTGQRAMMASHGRNCGLSTETPPGRMHHACNWSYLLWWNCWLQEFGTQAPAALRAFGSLSLRNGFVKAQFRHREM